MTLYIHIGFGKTGTTSIQDFFYRHREEFSRKGLLYPEQGLCGSGHHFLARLGLERMPTEVDRLFVEIRQAIDQGRHQATLLSSENFCFMRPEYVERVAEVFEGCKVKILFYIRSQVPLVESAFLEWQKVGSDYRKSIDHFFGAHARSFDFMLRIRPWMDFFGQGSIQARLYDKNVIGGDVRGDILRQIGVQDLVEIKKMESSNFSLLPEYSTLVCMFDELAPDAGRRRRFINELLSLSKQFKASSMHSLIGAELKKKIIDEFDRSNRRFADLFLDSEQSELFLRNPSPAPTKARLASHPVDSTIFGA